MSPLLQKHQPTCLAYFLCSFACTLHNSQLIVKALNWYSYQVARETKDELPSHLYDLRQQVLRQQNYHCPITGMIESGYPKLSSEMTSLLAVFHILHRPVLEGNTSQPNTQIDFFGSTTREMIQNYINPKLDWDRVPYDEPRNTIVLELNMYTNLSHFLMSLKATAVSEPLSHNYLSTLCIEPQRICRRDVRSTCMAQ
ncbi:uncharacterized protein EV420DRAFT_1534906 [Desarmillaria tabescens]|uniref:Uncharacterized protein n=1 Tax=Armillaria tabescens TaxID=1929756 RepID=A0AA39N783_ARMTA|nr:uncharacterized protein EV420DRAFT_1534906 [Desarmillaria tabescens]KAK0460083.1 hypothetical protein EV420DRAFT_1534906 [Desarmillaria tabescens]